MKRGALSLMAAALAYEALMIVLFPSAYCEIQESFRRYLSRSKWIVNQNWPGQKLFVKSFAEPFLT